MTKNLSLPSLLLSILALTGCGAQTMGTGSVDLTAICETSEWRVDSVASVCKAGQKVAFLPERWGNEQLPVKFAAVNCDLTHSVVMTNGGVTCIYRPITQVPAKSE